MAGKAGISGKSRKALGSVCIVLHGHLPYVLHHRQSPHGECWLFEAAAETYLPLLAILDEFIDLGVTPALALGLTPVLLEQLQHKRFVTGFETYLADRHALAETEMRRWEGEAQSEFVRMATLWRDFYAERASQFAEIDRDIPKAFAARAEALGIEFLGGPATHAYAPLLLHDESYSAQLACGRRVTKQRLGVDVDGCWLAECGYRSADTEWTPPILGMSPRPRAGIEQLLHRHGYGHFFVDAHLLTRGQVMGLQSRGVFREVVEEQLHWDPKRGWRLPMDPVGVVSAARAADCFAFARHPKLSEQVWSAKVGYPGAGPYLDFHRRFMPNGLRYHRVTDISCPLDKKLPYQPDDVPGVVHEHATHFCAVVRETLKDYQAETGHTGVCLAPFDAELFGHWWFEGPSFLRDVLLTLHHDKQVDLTTPRRYLQSHPPEKVLRLAEGSWGEGGHHHVWLNERTQWMWEMEYRAESRMISAVRDRPPSLSVKSAEALESAGRELLLMQASDWPFVVHSRGAVDYGHQRMSVHGLRFDRAMEAYHVLLRGDALSPQLQAGLAEMAAHDVVFEQIDLRWWESRD